MEMCCHLILKIVVPGFEHENVPSINIENSKLLVLNMKNALSVNIENSKLLVLAIVTYIAEIKWNRKCSNFKSKSVSLKLIKLNVCGALT